MLSFLFSEYSNLHCSNTCWNSTTCAIDQLASNCTQLTDNSLCNREGGLSYAVVSLGTVWIGLALYNFRKRLVLDVFTLSLPESIMEACICSVVLTFESVDEILRYDHSNETSSAVLLHGTICFSIFYKMKFVIFPEF